MFNHDVVDDDTSMVVVDREADIPVLAGIEARVVTRRGYRVRRLTEKAALAAPPPPSSSETFTARMKDRFILRGPQEGGNGSDITIPEPTQAHTNEEFAKPLTTGNDLNDQVSHEVTIPVNGDTSERPNNLNMPLLARQNLGIDIVSEFCGKYGNDPMFRAILDKPSDFRNFEIKDQLIYLKENDRRVLCIPKILSRVLGCKTTGSCKMQFFKRSRHLRTRSLCEHNTFMIIIFVY